MSDFDLGGAEFILGVGSITPLEGGRRRVRRVPFGFRAPEPVGLVAKKGAKRPVKRRV